MTMDDAIVKRRARGRIARRRGAFSGLTLFALGAWGALIPFVGPYFHYGYTPDDAWRWTASRGWLEVLPGTAAALGGLLVLFSSRRATAVLGAWLAAAAGAWFAIGISLVPVLHTGTVGAPASGRAALRVLEALGFFYGLGVVIVFFAATAFGRLSVRSLADIHVAQRTLDEERGATLRTQDAEMALPDQPGNDRTGHVQPQPYGHEHPTPAGTYPTEQASAPPPVPTQDHGEGQPAAHRYRQPSDSDSGSGSAVPSASNEPTGLSNRSM
jgi:hypothetical protein